MADLKREYVDMKNVTHKVEHIIGTVSDDNREQIIEEVLQALTKPQKRRCS